MRLLLFLGILAFAGPASAGATLLQIFPWHEPLPTFGGLSGLELTDDGNDFYALSDKSNLFRGHLVRKDGRITGVEDLTTCYLHDMWNKPMPPGLTDSEGLALAPDSTLYVSFEGLTRIWSYANPCGIARLLPPTRAFEGMQRNASLESIAIGPDGAIYTMPERSGRADRPFPVYRFWHGQWTIPFSIPRRGEFLISGADFGPDGKLYILERDFMGFGFRTRVRRFDLDGGGETVLLQSPVRQFDNLEGLSVWRDGDGHIRLTMISDDNFKPFQQTQIVEYRLD